MPMTNFEFFPSARGHPKYELFRNFKHIESSFEKKNPTSTEPSDEPVDDWMFNQTVAMQSTNAKTEPERKISSEADWMIDEIQKLTAGKERGYNNDVHIIT